MISTKGTELLVLLIDQTSTELGKFLKNLQDK